MADGSNHILVGELSLDISKLRSQVEEANKILQSIGVDAAKNIKQVSQTYQQMINDISKFAKASQQATSSKTKGSNISEEQARQNRLLKEARDLYSQLTQAQREYLNAIKNGDVEQKKYWQDRITKSRITIDNLKKEADANKANANTYQKIIDLINKAANAQSAFNNKVSDATAKAHQYEEKLAFVAQRTSEIQSKLLLTAGSVSNVGSETKQSISTVDALANSFSNVKRIVQAIAGISLVKIFRDALDYAKAFDKAITDMAVVTRKPIEDIRAIGGEYRELANDLGVSSTSIAESAVTIARQGFTDLAEISAIVEGVTKFGAVTDQTPDQAIQTMTASMQNFQKEGESMEQLVGRIGDTWSYMGDSVATDGQQIAEAMSKASASVKSVGLEFERASAYAAVMLAKTQQSGSVIGTQLNTLVSRYSKITSTGFDKITEDDEGEALSFNDVSKALREAGIEIYDAAAKTFMPMGNMLDELSAKWGTLDEATRKYIATSLGGTRGMNYLLTLLQNYDEATALYLDSLGERGIVDEKYETWLKGVEAAQNNLKNSLESLYAVLSSDVLAGFYNTIANIVDVLTKATEATNGFNIKGMAFIATAAGIAVAISKIISLFTKMIPLIKAGNLMGIFTMPGGLGAIIAAFGVVHTLIGLIGTEAKTAQDRLEVLNEEVYEKNEEASRYKTLKEELDSLSQNTNLTTEEMTRLKGIQKELIELNPSLAAQFGIEADGLAGVAEMANLAAQGYDNAREAMQAYLALGLKDQITSSNNKISKITVGDPGLRSYADYLGYNPHLTEETGVRPFIEDMSGYFASNASLDSLRQYKEDLSAIMNAEWYSGLGDSIKEIVEDEFNSAYNVVITKEAELAEVLSTEIAAIIPMALADVRTKLDGNEALKTLLPEMLANADYGDVTDMNIVSEAIKNFATALAKHMDGTDPTMYFEGENSFAERLFEAYLSGGMSDFILKSSFDTLKRMQDGMSQKTLDFLLMGEDVDIVRDALIEYKSAIDDVINSVDIYSSFSDPNALKVKEAIRNGDFSRTLIDQFREALKLGMSEDEVSAALENILTMDEASFLEWLVEVKPEVALDDEDLYEEVINLESEIQSAIDSIKGEIGIGVLPSVEELGEIEKLQRLLDKASELREQIGAKGIFSEDMSMESFSDTIEQIELLVEAYTQLMDGTFDFADLAGLVEDVPLLSGLVGDEEDTKSGIEAVYEMLVNGIYEVAEALGYTIPKLDEWNNAVDDILYPMDTAEKAMQELRETNNLSLGTIEKLANEYPELKQEIHDYVKEGKDAEKMIKALNKAHKDKSVREWVSNVTDAIEDVEKATEGTADYSEAMNELGMLFTQGWGDLSSLEFATQNLDNIKAAANGSVEAFHALQNAAWVNIVGNAHVDFSAATNGLALVGEQAEAVGNMLASVGLGTVEYQKLDGYADVVEQGANGWSISRQNISGNVAVWKPTSQNPFSFKAPKSSGGSSGGGGGGGGGGGSISVSKATDKMLTSMSDRQTDYDNRLKMLELRKEYHDIRGELVGVIKYTELETEVLNEQNNVLEENIKQLEAEIAEKEAVMAANKESSKKYKQAAVDVEELKEQHQEYSEALLENTNQIEENSEALKEYKRQQNQTIIDVEDLLRETLEGEAELQKSMLDGTVELQDLILEAITARYEKEQELAIETAEKKKEAIQAEIDAIDELIEERRKLIDEEEEELEIAELEAKIARISADPTRRKELLELESELNEKRKEQAWNRYEEEMGAQKDLLNEEIDNIDDWIDYINEYYEDLFEHPDVLIAEMKQVMTGTDDEIIAWLKKNYEGFAEFTDEKKQQVMDSWQEIINQANGYVEAYNEKIQELMTLSSAELLEWLKKHNVDFKNSTEAQQKEFISSWTETLEALENAFKNVETKIDVGYSKNTSSSSGGGDGGGGGGGTIEPTRYSATAIYQYRASNGNWGKVSTSATSYDSKDDAIERAKDKAESKAEDLATWSGTGKKVRFVKAYREGGLASSTGLAWIDGTKTKPERILSAYQTELFEDLIKTLHMIRTFSLSNVTRMGAPELSGMNGFNIEQINVNVSRLDGDADYDEIAEQVGERIRNEIVRTMSIGGIRI